MNSKYDKIKLDNQLCFPLYAASKEIVRKYKPFLDELDMTYTQYITMMVMWEHKELSVKELGSYLYLDSGTLTPLLRNLEKKGWIERKQSQKDGRYLDVTITELGESLKDKAITVPDKIASCVKIDPEEALQLYKTLQKILDNI